MFSDTKFQISATTKCRSATPRIGMLVPSAPANRMFLFSGFSLAVQESNKRFETVVAAVPVSTNANTDSSLTLLFTYLLDYWEMFDN